MSNRTLIKKQQGAALIVGVIMLMLITMAVISAFNISSGNAKAVGNMQYREEAVAAATDAIETIISSDFTTMPVAAAVNVDINADNLTDFVVQVAAPVCVQVTPAAGSELESLSGEESNVSSTNEFNTLWEIQAQVTDEATGATVTLVQGVRKKMNDLQYNASSCS